jgi:hypothetical protein
MITFDNILPVTRDVLLENQSVISRFQWLLINRDLYGKVRLIAPDAAETDESLQSGLSTVCKKLCARLGRHAHSLTSMILYEASLDAARQDAAIAPMGAGLSNVFLVDRLATEGVWAKISPEIHHPPHIVFFSIKGGVGRSTALAATAWSLAQAGKRVLVADLDLESPGLSLSLLPPDRQPKYGITDWFVEDLVDNTDSILDDMIATSNLSHDGEIYVVPAHGADPGEYVVKLGRVWMPKVQPRGAREPWHGRLQRLLQVLEARVKPDVVLIDSRAGIDDVASASVTGLGATLVLLFALEGIHTWNGYRILFEHWRRSGVARAMRQRLQIVAGLVPENDRATYLSGLREHAYEIFIDSLYDEIAPSSAQSSPAADSIRRPHVGDHFQDWNFDEADESAPHYPLAVNWSRGFSALQTLHGRLAGIDPAEMKLVFGSLLEGVISVLDLERRA